MANRIKPWIAVLFCTLFFFGCDGNHDPLQKKTEATKNHSMPAQGKQGQDDGAAVAQSTAGSAAAVSNSMERSGKRHQEERRINRIPDAEKKSYPPRVNKAVPRALDSAALSEIQTQAERYYKSMNSSARIQALEEIGKISSDSASAVNTFVDALNDADAQVRIEAVNQLSNSDQQEALTGLLAALNDSHPDVVIEALNNLAFMDDPALAEQISPLLASPNAQVNAAAAKAIEFIKQ